MLQYVGCVKTFFVPICLEFAVSGLEVCHVPPLFYNPLVDNTGGVCSSCRGHTVPKKTNKNCDEMASHISTGLHWYVLP